MVISSKCDTYQEISCMLILKYQYEILFLPFQCIGMLKWKRDTEKHFCVNISMLHFNKLKRLSHKKYDLKLPSYKLLKQT